MDEVLEEEWEKFLLNDNINISNNSSIDNKKEIPKSSELYISTKTKISYLSIPINLYEIFWKIPLTDYNIPKVGIIKKQMKFNFINKEDIDIVEKKLEKLKYVEQNIITQIMNPEGRIKFKDIRKISIGLCKKDILSYRTKKKSAFYNCFVLIMRLLYNDVFREIHIKVFNTGKLEIPGIQNDELLTIVLDNLIQILKPYICDGDLHYLKEKTETVLINSNFNCGYYINREKLFDILKYKYKINSSFDPCSYPGIQCEFYYDTDKHDNSGRQINNIDITNNSENIFKISFMIFRTGSVLIVGKCDEHILYDIYNFIKKILEDEYSDIVTNNIDTQSLVKKKKQVRKKIIYVND
jgi:TATA-box binding protein (TBP) (component of TFIID and TFIIIB)